MRSVFGRSAFVHVLPALLLLFQVTACFAAGETRLALVIGQSSYRAVPALPNAGNDAKRMAELLASAGFDVTSAPDLSQSDMRQAISDFAGKVATNAGAIALVFYAGHGIQVDGENYLVPVDVDPKREADVPLQAIRLNDLMNTLGALPTKMRIVMLDACRNNPFPALSGGGGHGLAIVDTKAGASGSFISYSTSPGSEAEDGNGEDSPYTTAVLQIAKEPNVPIEEAFKRVRVSVSQATDGRQIPWESSSLTSDFKFFGDGAGQPAPTKPSSPAGAAATSEDWKKELQGKDPRVAYTLVIRDDSVAAYEGFVSVFAQAPQTPRLRSLLERRREMTAWADAVALNTGAAFETFLASYGSSDLAVTARRMAERVRNRTLPATALASLGPICPAPTLPKLQPLKKDDQQPTRRVDKPATKKPIKEVVDRTPPKEQGPPPGAVMEGIGIGIGIGLGGGMGGGGMGGGGSRGGGGGMNSGHRSY